MYYVPRALNSDVLIAELQNAYGIDGHEDRELRVIAIGPTFASLVSASFDEICGSEGGNVAIMLRSLGALQTIGSIMPANRKQLVQIARWETRRRDPW